MIPTAHDYYRARAREHRRLALAALAMEQRARHETLAEAYTSLAQRYKLRQIVTLRI